MKYTITTLFLFGIVCFCYGREVPKMEFPVHVIQGGFLEDGGSIYFHLKGSRGRKLKVFIDRRTITREQNKQGFNKLWCFNYPGGKGAEIIENDSEEAQRILAYLKSASENYYPGYVDDWSIYNHEALKAMIALVEPVAGGDATR